MGFALKQGIQHPNVGAIYQGGQVKFARIGLETRGGVVWAMHFQSVRRAVGMVSVGQMVYATCQDALERPGQGAIQVTVGETVGTIPITGEPPCARPNQGTNAQGTEYVPLASGLGSAAAT